MTTERGFTLVELMVAVAIAMLFAVGIVAYSLARRPAALRTAVDRYDALMVQARSLAAASGNGATLVFLPRSNAAGTRVPGFTLRLYRGRPNATGALAPAVAAQVISDADIREARLGTPPFAVFLASDGSASALGAYPPSAGGFPTIANQPPCPGAQVTLEFRVPQAADTRLLSCSAPRAYGSARPYASPTPNLPLVDPPISYFHWPGAPRKQFVAVEFGYTRWFAAAGFTCTTQDGTPIATLPHNAPAPPYSPADSPQDAQAQPQPPADAPYAYASSTTSMQDAPATFYADPQGSNAGICYLPIQDAYAQVATEELVTMGALALSTPTIAFASPAAAAQTVDLEKTYDVVPIVATIAASTCAGIARVALGTGSAPATPSSVPATAPITVTAQSPGACSVTFGDQYSAQGEPPVTLAIAVRRAGSALTVVPASLVYPAPGSALYYDSTGGFFSGAPGGPTQESGSPLTPALAGGGAQSLSNGVRPDGCHVVRGVVVCTSPPPTFSPPPPTPTPTPTPTPAPTAPPTAAPTSPPGAGSLQALANAGLTVTSTGNGPSTDALCPKNVPVVVVSGPAYGCDYGGPYPQPIGPFSGTPNAVSVSGGSKSDTYAVGGHTCVSNNIANPTYLTPSQAGPGPGFFGMVPVNVGSCQITVDISSGPDASASPAQVGVQVAGVPIYADIQQYVAHTYGGGKCWRNGNTCWSTVTVNQNNYYQSTDQGTTWSPWGTMKTTTGSNTGSSASSSVTTYQTCAGSWSACTPLTTPPASPWPSSVSYTGTDSSNGTSVSGWNPSTPPGIPSPLPPPLTYPIL
ncbi:MAG: prepilin-type N-terminal cleavage/methylation domain-containing protein [Vulcanimicrobiaceae bacterium]